MADEPKRHRATIAREHLCWKGVLAVSIPTEARWATADISCCSICARDYPRDWRQSLEAQHFALCNASCATNVAVEAWATLHEHRGHARLTEREGNGAERYVIALVRIIVV